MNPVIVPTAPVASAERFGAYRQLTIEAPEIAASARPGQFLNICVQPGGAHLLRRPFSIARADRTAGTVLVVFHPVGLGPQWLGGGRSRVIPAPLRPLRHRLAGPPNPRVEI